MKVEVRLCAVDCGPFIGIPAEHTYVLSPNHFFNCFGRWEGGRDVRTARLSEEWASQVFGPDEKIYDAKPAAGLRVRYDGMCHNASNRILALADEEVDARGTNFNAVTTIMYGKYGFDVPAFIDTVMRTGEQLARALPDEVKIPDIERAVNRLKAGQTADAELGILHDDINAQFAGIIGRHLPAMTSEQFDLLRPIYSDYQVERKAAWDAIPKEYGDQVAWDKYPSALQKPWPKCVERMAQALSPEQFKDVFGVEPATLSGVTRMG